MDDTKKIPSLKSTETEPPTSRLTDDELASNKVVIDYLCSRIENAAA